MNTYTRSMTQESADRSNAGEGKIKVAGFAARISLLILLIFFSISAQMHLRVEIERLNKQATKIRMEISELNVKCTNLRNRKEKLTSWDNIHARIRNYRLGLRDADHLQISYISLQEPRGISRTLRPAKTARTTGKNNAVYAHNSR